MVNISKVQRIIWASNLFSRCSEDDNTDCLDPDNTDKADAFRYISLNKNVYDLHEAIKAAIINILIYTMDQIAMCNMTGVARSEPTENYNSILQLPLVLLSFF